MNSPEWAKLITPELVKFWVPIERLANDSYG